MTGVRDPAVPAPDAVIWRYMDDWKFEHLLDTFSANGRWRDDAGRKRYINIPGQLWFTFPRYLAVGSGGAEGELPAINRDPERYCDAMAAAMNLPEHEAKSRKERLLRADIQTLLKASHYMAQLCGISCWHENPQESEDMWNSIAADDGVAIRSTPEAIANALAYAHNSLASQAAPSLCAVGYIDHNTYLLPADGYRNLLSLVRYSWSYENEVRFVAKSPGLAKIKTTIRQPLPESPEDWESALKSPAPEIIAEHVERIMNECRVAFEVSLQQSEKGFDIPLKLEDCINEVVLAPTCSREYEHDVRQQLKRVGLHHVAVKHSDFWKE